MRGGSPLKTRAMFWGTWILMGSPVLKLAERFAVIYPMQGLKYVVLRDHVSIISGAFMGFLWSCLFILLSSFDPSGTCTGYSSVIMYFLAHVLVMIMTTAFAFEPFRIQEQANCLRVFAALRSETLGGYIGYLIGLSYSFQDVVLPGKRAGGPTYVPMPMEEWCHPGWRFTAFSWSLFVFFASIYIAFGSLPLNDHDKSVLSLVQEAYSSQKQAQEETRLMASTGLETGTIHAEPRTGDWRLENAHDRGIFS